MLAYTELGEAGAGALFRSEPTPCIPATLFSLLPVILLDQKTAPGAAKTLGTFVGIVRLLWRGTPGRDGHQNGKIAGGTKRRQVILTVDEDHCVYASLSGKFFPTFLRPGFLSTGCPHIGGCEACLRLQRSLGGGATKLPASAPLLGAGVEGDRSPCRRLPLFRRRTDVRRSSCRFHRCNKSPPAR